MGAPESLNGAAWRSHRTRSTRTASLTRSGTDHHGWRHVGAGDQVAFELDRELFERHHPFAGDRRDQGADGDVVASLDVVDAPQDRVSVVGDAREHERGCCGQERERHRRDTESDDRARLIDLDGVGERHAVRVRTGHHRSTRLRRRTGIATAGHIDDRFTHVAVVVVPHINTRTTKVLGDAKTPRRRIVKPNTRGQVPNSKPLPPSSVRTRGQRRHRHHTRDHGQRQHRFGGGGQSQQHSHNNQLLNRLNLCARKTQHNYRRYGAKHHGFASKPI